jgi:spore coat assembly protein SafA
MGATQYIVQQGDTMWTISQRFGISLDSLIRANPQVRNPDLINVGESSGSPVPVP